MRLIAWNANDNNQSRSFEEDLALLAHLNGDIIVLSETSRPKAEASGKVVWIGGKGPGLAVAALNGYSVEPSQSNVDAPRLSGGFKVEGPLKFNLLAVWPVRTERNSYAQILDATLNCYADLLSRERVVLAGDLNSNTRVIHQAQSHPRFVTKAKALGLTSVYHHKHSEEHGSETKGTYRQGKKAPRPFCLDYCFVPTPWLDEASLQILDGPEWEGRSDHFPLVLKLPDGL